MHVNVLLYFRLIAPINQVIFLAFLVLDVVLLLPFTWFFSDSMMLLSGQPVAQKIIEKVRATWAAVQPKTPALLPHLVIIQVGDDPASTLYVQRKISTCRSLGFIATHHTVAASCSQIDLQDLIVEFNQTPRVHGILLQLPLPAHLDSISLLQAIVPHKDVDGLTPTSIGLLNQGAPGFIPCTARAVLELLTTYNLPIARRHAVVVGASDIVGKPTALALLHAQATVTICHAATADLAKHVRQADILIVAIGNPNVIQADWLQPHSVVIDVGINRDAQNRVIGDIPTQAVQAHVHAISPVPGGVGPVTVAMLMDNLLQAFLAQRK